MKQASAYLTVLLLISVGGLFFLGQSLNKEINGLKDQLLTEEFQRNYEDQRILEQLDDSLDKLLMQIGVIEKEIQSGADFRNLEALLPEEYVEEVRTLIKEQVEIFIDQQPVFGAAWEILSVHFVSPNMIAVKCRDGEIKGTLLVWIYPGEKGGYTGEVLYSDIRPWAG